MVSQHGNDLGRDQLIALEQICKDEGYQFLLEMVTRSEEDEARCAVVFQEGRVKEPAM